ncbi:hypothetical protein [Caballeronia arationis]|uniref:hypothetical protein n=1 Tax=Caballeronia arationis TaxID=1777142 RepID=UPI000B18E641|nr:hypothetical protein [Caballeronia arationis]
MRMIVVMSVCLRVRMVMAIAMCVVVVMLASARVTVVMSRDIAGEVIPVGGVIVITGVFRPAFLSGR